MATSTSSVAQRDVADVHAAIDIGTNSVHLLVGRMGSDGRIDVLTREKDPVRLGSGSGDMSLLTDAAIDRGIESLARMKRIADSANADITAVATSAVREADNRDTFLERAREEAGIEVEVISGVEEARLIHLGVLQALPLFEKRALIIDIGGGSTELLIGQEGRVYGARSIKLGAIRLTERFFGKGTRSTKSSGKGIKRSAVEECRTYVRAFLAPVQRELVPLGYDAAAGSSGTITTLAMMADRRAGGTATRANGLVLTRQALGELIDDIARASDRSALPGLDPRRADIILGGALLLEQVFEAFELSRVTASDFALREGLFLDRHQERLGGSFHHLSDIRREGVQRLADLFREDYDHVRHATDLALRIFDETQPLHLLTEMSRDYLEAAGWLHNVGLFVSHAAHHKHSYYVIRHSDQLLGFTDREVELIAQVARYHRKSEPKAKHAEFQALRPEDKRIVSVLAGILRVAIALDRTHQLLVSDVDVDIGGGPDDPIRLRAITNGDVSLELYTARLRGGLLAKQLGRQIEFS